MRTRITAITMTAAALTAGAAMLPSPGRTSAAPDDGAPTFEPVPGDQDVVPTSGPPPTFDGASAGPVVLGAHAPERTPVTTAPGDRTPGDRTAGDRTASDRTASPTKIELDPGFAPNPEHLAPCGTVPYNLEPVGPIRLVDMTGDGSADDRLSIRRDASGGSTRHLLHLELATGERSEAPIPRYEAQTPEISFVVQLDDALVTDTHPAPTADEVIVAYGTRHTADDTSRFFELFGTDERGCLSPYSFTSAPQGLLFQLNDAGRAGFECDADRNLTRSRTVPYGSNWSVIRQPLVRHDATTVFAQAGSGTTVTTSQLPFLTADC